MVKKFIFAVGIVTAISCGMVIPQFTAVCDDKSDLLLSNAEVLADPERPPEWWDFFNNYVVTERIPITSSQCAKGSISYNGVTVSLENCMNYSFAIIAWCYDGGNRDECTSAKVIGYI